MTAERVQWATRLGCEEALVALGNLERPPLSWDSWWDRYYVLRAVSEVVAGRDFKRLLVFYAADCAARALPLFESRVSDGRPRRAIEAARAWASDPCESSLRAARAAGDEAWRAEQRRRRGAEETLTRVYQHRRRNRSLSPEEQDAGIWAQWESVESTPEALAAHAARAVIDEVLAEGGAEGSTGCGATEAVGAAASAMAAVEGSAEAEGLELSWQQLRLADYALGRAKVEGLA